MSTELVSSTVELFKKLVDAIAGLLGLKQQSIELKKIKVKCTAAVQIADRKCKRDEHLSDNAVLMVIGTGILTVIGIAVYQHCATERLTMQLAAGAYEG
jgi:hypothetical protein